MVGSASATFRGIPKIHKILFGLVLAVGPLNAPAAESAQIFHFEDIKRQYSLDGASGLVVQPTSVKKRYRFLLTGGATVSTQQIVMKAPNIAGVIDRDPRLNNQMSLLSATALGGLHVTDTQKSNKETLSGDRGTYLAAGGEGHLDLKGNTSISDRNPKALSEWIAKAPHATAIIALKKARSGRSTPKPGSKPESGSIQTATMDGGVTIEANRVHPREHLSARGDTMTLTETGSNRTLELTGNATMHAERDGKSMATQVWRLTLNLNKAGEITGYRGESHP